MTNKTQFIQGETAIFSVQTVADSVSVLVGNTSFPMVSAEGVWSVSVPTDSLKGRIRYAVFAVASGVRTAIESGFVFVAPLVSRYRAVVDAIDEALQGVATNGKYSISVGEISLTDKTFDEMLKALSYYRSLAEEDETGEAETGRVTTIQTRFV